MQLEFLLSCCKGLQSPFEDEIRTPDERIQEYQKSFDERNRILSSEAVAVELARSMEQVIQGAVLLWPHETQIAEVNFRHVVRDFDIDTFFFLTIILDSLFRKHARLSRQ